MVDFVHRKETPAAEPAKDIGSASMVDHPVLCPHCGTHFSVLQALVNAEAICPGCAKSVLVPPAPATGTPPEPAAPKSGGVSLKHPRDLIPNRAGARVKKPKPAAPDDENTEKIEKPSVAKLKSELKKKPKCPECESLMDPDDVFCVNCGFDRRKGKPSVPSPEKRSKVPFLLLLIVAAAAGVIGYLWWTRIRTPGRATLGRPAAESDAKTAAKAPPAAEPMVEPVADPVAASTTVDEAAPAAPAEEPPPVAIADAPPPVGEPPGESLPSSRETEARALVEGKLNQQFPLLARGDKTTLKTKDGRTYQGAFAGVAGTVVQLESEGTLYELQIGNLDRRSRSRVDEEYRNQLIDVLTKKYFAR